MQPTRVYTAGQHRFFDDLFNMLVAYLSFGVAVQVSQGADPSFAAEQNINLQGSSAILGVDLLIRPSGILAEILEDQRPDRLEFRQFFHIEWDESKRREPQRVVAPMIHSAFVHYYESVVDQIEATHGPSRTWHSWPELLRFGRTVRKAFTHGGQIHVTDPKAPSATWHGLTYGPAENGQQVLHSGLMPADVVLLMEEMDREF